MADGRLDERLNYPGDTCDRLARFLTSFRLPVSHARIYVELVDEDDFWESHLRRNLARFTEEGWLDRRRSLNPDRSENYYYVTPEGHRAFATAFPPQPGPGGIRGRAALPGSGRQPEL